MAFIAHKQWMVDNAHVHFYLYPKSEQPVDIQQSVYTSILKYYLLFNSMIPLDLTVIFILSKMLYTFRLEWDASMIDEQKSLEYGSI